MIDDELALFLREPNLARLATINADGTPHVMPIWYLHQGSEVLLITNPASHKVRNIRRDPRVVVCIDRPTPPYAGVVIRGIAALEEVEDQDLAVPMAVRYLGTDAGVLVGAKYAAVDRMTIRVPLADSTRWDFGKMP